MAVARIVNEPQTDTKLMRAPSTAAALNMALPTLYELARKDPSRFGVVRLGRSVRFRRAAIDRIVQGEV